MSKRNISNAIVALVLLGIFGAMAACGSSQKSSTKSGITPADLVVSNESNSGSTYNKKGFDDDYITYSIEDSSCVIYNFDDIYLMGEASEIDTGTCYWFIQVGNPTFREPKLIGVSDKYLFFSVRENSVTDETIDIAVEIEETIGGYLNSRFHQAFLLDELTDEEKVFHSVNVIES